MRDDRRPRELVNMPIDCPRCKKLMRLHQIQKVEVDYCEECYGIWLDAIELERITRKPYIARYVNSTMGVAKKSDISCPACEAPLKLQDLNGVEIDTCPTCGGTWLDFGEIEQINRVRQEDLLMTAGTAKKERLEIIENLFDDED